MVKGYPVLANNKEALFHQGKPHTTRQSYDNREEREGNTLL